MGHPEAEDKLINVLKKVKAWKIYKDENWSDLHEFILNLLKQGLCSLYEALQKFNNKEDEGINYKYDRFNFLQRRWGGY